MKFFRTIFKDSLHESWRNKYLWFFGFFAALWGSGAELDLLFGNFGERGGTGLFAELQTWADTGIFSAAGWSNIGRLAFTEPFTFFILISILLAVLILFLFVVWISITSQAALVYNSGKIRLDKKHSFKDGWQAGTQKFWTVFGLNLGLRVFLSLLFVILSIPIIKSQGSGVVSQSGMIFILLFLVFIPISIIASFLVKYAVAFVVIKSEKLVSSLKLSWRLFIDNWLLSLEMSFMLFVFSFLGAVLIILAFLIVMAPIMFVVLLFQDLVSVVNVFVIIITIFILYLCVIVVFGSFFTSFKTLSWTHLFIDLISKGGKSKLNRVFSK